MKHRCTSATDLDELIGREGAEGFQYGPLALAMKRGDELVLEDSDQLSRLTVAKIHALLHGLFIVETAESIQAPAHFRLVFL
jgi:hypothetical protein